MAILLGRLVSARFRPIPARGAGAALLLGLDPDMLAPAVECLAGDYRPREGGAGAASEGQDGQE